ncbi:MAG: hypothetical protein QXE93_02250, partial [Candidatus Pacearchaeota archaeon]
MYRALARLFPWYSKKIEKLAMFIDFKKDPKEFAGFIVFLAFILGIVAFIFVFFFLKWFYAIACGVAMFFIVLGLFELLLNLKADARAKEAEAALPDALQLMATNLRAGLTTEKALLVSAREEF